MAKIIENEQGRRLIRLTPDDILMVVGLYQKQCHSNPTTSLTYEDLKSALVANPLYLPEEV